MLGLSSMFSLHGRAAILTLLPLLIGGAYGIVQRERAELLKAPIDIGIEHSQSAAVSFTRSADTRPQFIDVANEGKETVFISLPAAWERGEVRGGALSSVAQDRPMFGYSRWRIPAGLTIAFKSSLRWDGATFHNPSGVPLRIKIITVHLKKGTSEREVYLLSNDPLRIP